MKRATFAHLALIALLTASGAATAQRAYLLNGIDEKVTFNDAGKPVIGAPGADVLTIMDIGTDPAKPRVVANLPLSNSLFGPPVNLQVTPDQQLALVASAIVTVKEGEGWKAVPDNKIYVIDLRADPPQLKSTLEVGKQPSGMAINARGDLALVAQRADKNVGVLAIAAGEVRLVASVDVEDEVAAVAITPDGKRALALKNKANKVAVLDIDGQKVSYDKNKDMPVGQFPYNVDITPNGRLALVAHTGNGGLPDGHADSIAVIDLSREPPRVIDYVGIGDAPEAFAISPKGDMAVALLLGGAILPKGHWAADKDGALAILKIDGGNVSKVAEIPAGPLPEGVAFSDNGEYFYVSSFFNKNVRVFRAKGTQVQDTGVSLPLPGHPGSMRARAR